MPRPPIGKKSPGGATLALVARCQPGRRGVGRAEAARRGSGETMIQAPSCRVLFASGGHAPRLGQITQRKLVTPAAGSLDKVEVILRRYTLAPTPVSDCRRVCADVSRQSRRRVPNVKDGFHAVQFVLTASVRQDLLHRSKLYSAAS